MQTGVESDVEVPRFGHIINGVKTNSENLRSREINPRRTMDVVCQELEPDPYEIAIVNNLSAHVDGFHDGLKSYQCKLCEFRTTQAGILKQHVNAKHKGLNKYQCELCEYSTALAGNLKIHVDTVHKRLKPYKCKLCEYSAAHASNLKKHVDAVHKGLKPYKC